MSIFFGEAGDWQSYEDYGFHKDEIVWMSFGALFKGLWSFAKSSQCIAG